MTRQVRVREQVIPKYYPLVKDTNYMHNILTSGRAGTKSSFISIESILELVAKGKSVVIMRKHHNKLGKTVYKECLRAINRLGIDKKAFHITKNPLEITYLKNGATIYFTGSDSIDDTKGMIDESHPISLVILDELTEFFQKGDGEDEITNIIATFVRGNDDNFKMFYLFNPPKNDKAPVMEWVRKMEQRPDTIHIHATYQDVPEQWLGKMLINEAEQMKILDEKMYNWLWLGQCTGLDDLIYYMFKEEKHVKEVDEQDLKNISYMYCGTDYGQMNATTFQVYGIDFTKKEIRGIDEYYHCGREEGQKSPSDYAKDFKEFKERIEQETKKKLLYIYIDPSAKGLSEEIKRRVPDITVKPANNTVLLGINRLQKLMSLQRLKLSPKQKNMIREIYTYEWNEDSLDRGVETPVKINDHCCDATRYAVMGMWDIMRQLLPILGDD